MNVYPKRSIFRLLAVFFFGSGIFKKLSNRSTIPEFLKTPEPKNNVAQNTEKSIALGIDLLYVRDFRFYATIGVYAHEKENPQLLSIDVELTTDFSQAIKSDDVKDTIDYDQIIRAIQQVAQQRHHDLLEVLAENIAQHFFSSFAVTKITLSLHKPNIIKEVAAIGVRIIRERN